MLHNHALIRLEHDRKMHIAIYLVVLFFNCLNIWVLYSLTTCRVG
jgi:hypothetical protein